MGTLPLSLQAGEQQYEALSASVRTALAYSISLPAPGDESLAAMIGVNEWVQGASSRLARRIPIEADRLALLRLVQYEAVRAGLNPDLVLGLIQVESGFQPLAKSSAGARGYMQVMPFWVRVIGRPGDDLFHMRTNLRYGCTILRHYIDIERGNLYRALGRYNGSLGRPEYPDLVLRAWRAFTQG